MLRHGFNILFTATMVFGQSTRFFVGSSIFSVVILVSGSLLLLGTEKTPPPLAPSSENPLPNSSKPVEVKFLGVQSCETCHSEIYTSWQQSGHATTLHPPTPKELTHVSENIFCSGHAIKYVLGGKHARRYLIESLDPKPSIHLLLPCRYDIGTQTWETLHMEDWQKMPFEKHCAACHTTNFSSDTLTFFEIGVGCESCHGPGNWHGDFEGGKMIAFRKRSALEEVTICASCHLQGGKSKRTGYPFPYNYVPGNDLFADYVFDWSELENAQSGPIDIHQKTLIKMRIMDASLNAQSLRCTSCHAFHDLTHKKHEKLNRESYCHHCHEAESFAVKNYKQGCNVCEF